MEYFDVIVIGAGASGLIAAGRSASLGAKVLLLEKMERAGRKLLITGKGRCNITNEAPMNEFFQHINPNGRFLKQAFHTCFSADIVSLLNKLHVETVSERGGRIFTATGKAADVVNALVDWCVSYKVQVRYGCKVLSLRSLEGRVTGVKCTIGGNELIFEANSVILCTGGNSYPATGSTGDGYQLAKSVGHSIEPVRPALVPLETFGDIAQNLQGLSLKNVNATVWVNGKKQREAFGEMLFTHFGISGPIILTISRFVVDAFRDRNQVEVIIDLKPALDHQKLDARLLRDLNEHGKKRIDNIAKEWLPSRMADLLLKECGLDGATEGHQVTSVQRRKILNLLKGIKLKVSGHRSFKEAIVTAGGISLLQVDSKTMESKLLKGLYFAGEVLDLDADTGGFNLQIAWSTAWLAAQSCCAKKEKT